MKLFLDRASQSVVGFSTVTVVRGRGVRYGEGERYLCDVLCSESYA